MTQPTPPDTPPTKEPLDPALIRLALVILVGAIAAVLDTTIVNVAIDTLQHRLHTSVSTIQWVTTGYILSASMTIPISGWAFERFGARRVWMLSLTAFVAGSALSGLAWSADSLIAFRIFQGIGGGMLIPLAQTILADAAGRERMPRIMPFIAIPAQLGPVLGPVIGGLIVTNVSWRWIFYVNVPICALAIALAWRTLPETTRNPDRHLDIRGLALLSPALALIVYGFSEAGATGGFGHTRVIVALIAGVAVLAVYIAYALRTRIEPVLNLRLLRARGYSTSSALMFLSGLSLFGALFLLPLFYQETHGASALQAGLLLAPQGAGVMIGALVAGPLVERLGTRIPSLVGMTLLTIATVPYALAHAHTSDLLLSAVLVVRGAGLGLALVPVMSASYIGLPHTAIPSATTGVRIFQQIGGALGTAILAVILQHAMPHAPTAAGVSHAFDTTFWWVLGLTALAFIPALLLPRRTTTAQPVGGPHRRFSRPTGIARAPRASARAPEAGAHGHS